MKFRYVAHGARNMIPFRESQENSGEKRWQNILNCNLHRSLIKSILIFLKWSLSGLILLKTPQFNSCSLVAFTKSYNRLSQYSSNTLLRWFISLVEQVERRKCTLKGWETWFYAEKPCKFRANWEQIWLENQQN